VAGEDFNISLGLDISAASKELAAFVADARKKARVVREELKSINFKVAPIKVKIDTKYQKDLDKVEASVARINKLKVSIGDKNTKTTGLASEKVPAALQKAAPSAIGTIQKRIKQLDGFIADRQIALQALLKSSSPGPVINTQIEVIKTALGKLQKERRELTASVSKQMDEIAVAQKELQKLIESPDILNAIKVEYEETKKANEARAKANRKAASERIALLKELEKLERGPEVVAAMKAQVQDFKDVQKRTSSALKKMRQEYADAKKQLDKTGSAADKKIVEDYVKKIKKTHDYLLWVTDELDVLSDASTSKTSGVKEITKGMRGSRGPSESGVKNPGNLPATRSTAPLGGKQYGAINEAADKILKLARETAAARGASSIGTIFDNQMAGGGAIANFMIPALRLLLPNKVSQEQADKASKGQGGIAVILRDTKADFSSMIDELKGQLENTSDSETELRQALEDLIDEFGNYVEDDEKGSTKKQKGSAEAAVNSEFVKGDSSEASGSIVTASEDMAKNLRDANQSTKELTDILSLGSKSKDKKAGIYTVSSDAASKGLSDEIAAVTAEELQMVFEAVMLAVEKANTRAKELRAAGNKSILSPSTPLTKIKDNGMFWSSETTKGASAERDESSSDAAAEDKAGRALQLVPIGITQTEIEKGFDRGFAKLVQEILGLKETPSIGLNAIGPYGIRSADGTIEGAVGAKKKDSSGTPGSKDIAAVARIIGPDSALTKVIQNILQKVNEGLTNPKLEPQLSMLSEDFTPMEWKALGEQDIVDIHMSLQSLQEEFLNTVLYFAALTQDNKIRTDTGQTRQDTTTPDSMSLLPGSSQSNPQLDTFFKLFNSTRTSGTKKVTALNADGSPMLNDFGEPITKEIKNIFDDFTEGVSPVVTALRYLSKVFEDIYKIPMAGNLGKTGKFNELGLPSASGTESTYAQAFMKNRNGFIADMLKASAPMVSVGKKDSTDKAGGAELPIEKLNGILEKLDRTTDGPAYGLKGTMDDGSQVDVNNFLLNEMANIFAKSSAAVTQGRITTDTGVRQGPISYGPMDAIRAKYGETVNGLTAGLAPGVSRAEQAGADTAQGFIDGYEGTMEIESPSKRMKRSGDNTIDGLEEGLFDGIARLDKAGRELADSFHTGWSEEARVSAAELIQKLEKEGTDAAKARIQNGLKMMRSAPPVPEQQTSTLPSMRTEEERKRLADVGRAAGAGTPPYVPPAKSPGFKLSTQEEIERRNAENLKLLDIARAKAEDILVALDIETTGISRDKDTGKTNRARVFGYSVVAGAGEFSREPGALPGTPVVTPSMTGVAHGMLVPPKDGTRFSMGAADALGLLGTGKNITTDILPNLIKRITSLGYGKEKTTGSEQEYVNQLEDIAHILRKLYDESIPLAIHSQPLSDLTTLGKEFAHYGIAAPTAGQFKDKGLLVETQSMGKMLGGYMRDLSGKVAGKVGAMYELLTGKTMGAELIPPVGNTPKLADKTAVAHDPTIDTAATLVNAFTMRNAAGQAGMSKPDLLGKSVQLLGATWQKVSDAIWGSRKFAPKEDPQKYVTGSPTEMKSFKRQEAVHGGQLQPPYGPQQAPAPKPAVEPVVPAQDPQQAAQEAGDAAARQQKLIDDLEKEKARIRKLKAQAEFQYEVDLLEEDQSRLKLLLADLDNIMKTQGKSASPQQAKDVLALRAKIAKKMAERPDVADAYQRQIQANGGIRSMELDAGGDWQNRFRAKKPRIPKSDLQKQLEKQIKETQAEIDTQLGTQTQAQPKTPRIPGSVIAAPLAELQAAEQRIQKSLTSAVASGLGPTLISRLEQELAYVQKSIKSGPVGKRRMRDGNGQLTSAEVDVFAAEGVRGAKDRVAGKSQITNIKKQLLAELKVAEEKGYTETIQAVSQLIAELDASVASGPVGKYKNGRDAFELPDGIRKRKQKDDTKLPNLEGTAAPGAYDNVTHQSWMDQGIEAEAKKRKAASEMIKGQMKGEMTVMAQVEKYNRKMMDSWISGRYALYDVANTYQQFQRVLMSVGREFQKAVQTFASYETSFTSVERAMQPLPDEFAGMRNEIVKLTGELPVAFDELSKITTLGAQMGIKADGITNFTEQVTKFSAITGLASDTVAQKFGRIAQLAKVPSEDFDKLGSAVAFAGVNAVATDEEILTLTENIAAAANNSGFAADEVVGLATAMSSLGIAPEQARGVITRLFGDINRAVEGGGKPLDAYAKHLGMSASQAKELWKSDPQGFFKAMLDGLKNSKNMTGALDGLNIKETREVSTLQKLANNMDVYNQSMADAQESYANGSFLSDSYAKTQDNLATKMELMNNQLKMLQDAFGQALSPAVGLAVDAINWLITSMNEWSKNPMAKVAMQIIAGIAGLIAVMVTYKMISMKATAATLAFRTAQVSLSKISGQDTGLNGFRKMLMGQEQLIIRSNGRIEVASKKRIKEMEAAGEIKIAPRGSSEDLTLRAGADARRAGFDSTKGMIDQKSGMAQATLTSNQDTIATLENTDAKVANTTATEANGAAAMTEAEAKTASALATQEEIAVIGEQISIKQAALALLENEILVKEASLGATTGNTVATEASIAASRADAAAIQGEIIALESKQAALAGTNVAQAETVALMTAGESITNKFGGALTKLTMAAGAISVVLMAVSAISSYIEGLKVNLEEAGGGIASFREAIYKDTSAWKDGADAIGTYKSKVTTQQKQITTWAESMQNATGSVVELDDKVTHVTESVKNQTLALGENSKEWLAQAVMKDDVVQKKFESWFDQGLDLDALAQQANVKISDMIGMALADPGKGAQDYLSAWFADGLIPKQYRDQLYGDLNDIAAALDGTTEAGLRNTKIWKALKGATGAAGDGLDEFDNNLNETIKRVYTLTDYVGDLSTIIGAAFTIRYGSVEAVDKLETSWAGVSDRLSEAKKQMQAINQEISAMTADKNILEYQLNIALKYGDTLRADKIRAELDTKRSEITNKQAEYNKAAEDASTGLTGNSRGAIANRDTILGLVGDYNSELAALANEYSKYTGKNQKADRDRIKAKADSLKSEFKTKAMGLGFAENELAPYVKSFEDFKTIVNKLPNTLTLKVVADPGTRAFMEWWAKSSENPANQTSTKDTSKTDKKKKKGQSGKVVGYNPSTTPIEDLKPTAVRGPTQAQQAGGFWYDVGNVGLNAINLAVQPINFAASAFTPSSWNGESSYMGNVERNWYAGNGGSKDNIWGSNKGKSKWTGYDAEYQQADYEKRLATWNKKHALPTGYKESDRAGLAAKHRKMYPGHYNPYDGSVNFYKEPPIVKKFGRPLADLASVHAALNPGKYNPYTQVVNPINLSAAQKKAASAWKDAKSLAELGKEHEKLYPGEYNPYTHSVNAGVIDISKSNNKQFADYLQHGGKSTDPMYVKNVNEALYKNAKDSPKDGWGNMREGWKLAGYNERGDAVYEYEKKAMGGFVGKRYESGGKVFGPGSGTSDSVPAMLSSGEYVIKADAAKALGPYVLNAINKGNLPANKKPNPVGKDWTQILGEWFGKQMDSKWKARNNKDQNRGETHGELGRIKSLDKYSNARIDSSLHSWRQQMRSTGEISMRPTRMPSFVGGMLGGSFGGGGLLDRNNMSSGGLVTGPGSSTSDSVPKMLSNGEYVVNARAVKTYGIDFLNALNRMQSYRQSYGSQQSASSGSGNIVVELSPEAVNQLMAMSNRPINLYSDDRQIATSANRGNRLLAMRGSN
jgi:TP901 family phage tail tape measure protein